jgi:hypothetical protein
MISQHQPPLRSFSAFSRATVSQRDKFSTKRRAFVFSRRSPVDLKKFGFGIKSKEIHLEVCNGQHKENNRS